MLRASLKRLCASALVINKTSELPSGGKLATLSLNHAVSRNAMTVGMGDAFKAEIEVLKQDPALRAVIITGAGAAFSAGGDLNFLRNRIKDTPEGNVQAMRDFYARFLSLRDLRCPVIAAINGHAIGAGLCVALACDFRIIAHGSRLAVNFTRIGIHPGMGATYSLPRLVGRTQAADLILTGREFTAEDALRMGLATSACEKSAIIGEAERLAESLATASKIAVEESVQTLRGDPAELDRALQREAEAQAACYKEGRDLDEALTALVEKRAPKFQNA
jgi:enoyl-CoA hydratase/carnithine racemase